MRNAVRIRWISVEQPWGRMRVWVGGAGPALLAIHGLGGSGRYWERLTARIGAHATVVAPDLAGFGGSDKPRVRYDRDLHLRSLDRVLEELDLAEPLAVVGHSLGGVLAALWTARHPERVRALALLAAPFPTGRAPAWAGMRPPVVLRATARAIRAVWPLVGLPIGLARGYPAGLVLDYGRQRLEGRTGTTASVLWDPRVLEELEALRELGHLRVLVAGARDDRTVSVADVDRWAELIPGAERLVLPEGGHQFPLRTGHGDLAAWLVRER